ncbi:hypothetical protein BS47DRAFT_1397776 [Hydnum rufescens UP504]|uniref:Uncharacterized protein n=1 Tax=Hydnum rufescens UP504 TaxID=1448309 RepID=A0A9P6DRH7_9AGAM|nr:hypothetical protein BS47DRAFT_1397776 [Hydnum rufescens UP504]
MLKIYPGGYSSISRARQGFIGVSRSKTSTLHDLSSSTPHSLAYDILGFMGSCSDSQFFDLQPSVDFDRINAHDATLEGCGPSQFLCKDEYNEARLNAASRSREPCVLDLTLLPFRSHSRLPLNRQKLWISPTLPILHAGRAHSHQLDAPMIALRD